MEGKNAMGEKMKARTTAAGNNSQCSQTSSLVHPETFSVVVPEWEPVKRQGPEVTPVVVTCFQGIRYVFVLK